MSKIWVLQHSPCEDLGEIEPVVRSCGLEPVYVKTYAGEPAPTDMHEAVALIVMGGPMGVYESDRYPFLRDEMRLIDHALVSERPVLGVCLGSQLLATALGAKVRQGTHKEIGWYQVTLSSEASTDPLWSAMPKEFCAFHWHGDVFDLPARATPMASSAKTAHQGFRAGNACGILFHMEVNARIVGKMVDLFADELEHEQHAGGDILEQAAGWLPELQKVGRTFFQSWSSFVGETTSL